MAYNVINILDFFYTPICNIYQTLRFNDQRFIIYDDGLHPFS